MNLFDIWIMGLLKNKRFLLGIYNFKYWHFRNFGNPNQPVDQFACCCRSTSWSKSTNRLASNSGQSIDSTTEFYWIC
jgi:hypothetical protein